ncbi:MAG: YfiR family protein, partial [Tunicatimonas sp.]|uniref:YfiR family protein n=1 Tax=Tunicatimonas sp. TaxID=1940096 RepID=UPI003C7904B0
TKGVRIKSEDIQALQASGTLVITELEDIQSKGSHINFIATKESKLGFELNQKAATNSGFKVAGSLAGLAAKTY